MGQPQTGSPGPTKSAGFGKDAHMPPGSRSGCSRAATCGCLFQVSRTLSLRFHSNIIFASASTSTVKPLVLVCEPLN